MDTLLALLPNGFSVPAADAKALGSLGMAAGTFTRTQCNTLFINP